ncbi:nitrate- and nitrite sensing domain-containing protein [Nonomuraea sp. 3N208]|uniref:nitrate- and nitrite sensing domain-containing protein n=1 Tax=Nonomuraea sp. 3N208 TaxID=3457421 RepID=UPI003FD44D2C
MIALILIPTTLGVLVGAQQVIASWNAAGQYHRILEKAELSASVTEVAHQLALERDLAMHYIAAGRTPEREEPLRAQFAVVDRAAAGMRTKAAAMTTDHGESAWTLSRQILTRLPEIAAARTTVLKTEVLALPTLTRYAQIIGAFQQFHGEIGQGGEDEALATGVRALSALAKAHEAASQQRGLLAAVASAGRFQSGELDRFMAARAQQDSELEVFRSVATLQERQAYDDTVTGTLVDRAEVIRLRALAQAGQSGPIDIAPESGEDAGFWFAAMSGTVDGMWTVQKRLGASIIVQSRALEDAARRDAVVAATYILLLLLLVLLITTFVAQSLVSPLRRLRREALDIAGIRLPRTVRRLRETGDESTLTVAPIAVDSCDEVGEVARAFDEVHREAIRLAGEESRLRANINAMFVNLSRRSQTLVQRQIKLIDGLEQGELDERRLADFFALDHLATRMRRNNESLLILAGQEPPRRWNHPVGLTDVVRAALSEVEGYQRVAVEIAVNGAIAGPAVNDTVHLLAELIENALSFSSRDTRVLVSTGRIDGGIMVSVTDTGIGMTHDELVQANERLARVPEVDVSVSRRMGLYVVARLAYRHGIRVQLRPHETGGLIAVVVLPDALLHAPVPAYSTIQTPPPSGFWDSAARPSRSAPSATDWPSFATDPVLPVPRRGRTATGPIPVTRPDTASVTGPTAVTRTDAASVTGPIPAVRPGSAGDDDYLPIFAQVQSAWFERGNAGGATWSSAKADAGWSAAEAAATPSDAGATTSGLPKRVPKANLVPGTAETTSAPRGVAPIPRLSPERIRSRLSSFQQGCRQARTRISTGDLPPFTS